MLRSFLVSLDESDFDEKILPYASALARSADVALHLAHVQMGDDGQKQFGEKNHRNVYFPDCGDLVLYLNWYKRRIYNSNFGTRT